MDNCDFTEIANIFVKMMNSDAVKNMQSTCSNFNKKLNEEKTDEFTPQKVEVFKEFFGLMPDMLKTIAESFSKPNVVDEKQSESIEKVEVSEVSEVKESTDEIKKEEEKVEVKESTDEIKKEEEKVEESEVKESTDEIKEEEEKVEEVH